MLTSKSKTFLLGEYSVLFGGCAIVLVTEPEFCMTIKKTPVCHSIAGIKKVSPAFLFYLKHLNLFQDISLEFFDPYNGSGGFGASSAQFVLLYKFYLAATNKTFCANQFLDEYRHISTNKAAGEILPSGADCLAQYCNNHIFFDSANNYFEKIEWPFDDICFSIFKTKKKVATHKHLSELKALDHSEISILNSCVIDAKSSFASKNSELLCKSIQKFYDFSCELGLVIENTQTIIQELLKYDYILAAKGCGALFADTILIIHKKQHLEKVRQICHSCNYIN